MQQFGQKNTHQKIAEYYDGVGDSYRVWSRSLNIHFGYYRRGVNPFDLESMLAQMNQEVLQRLDISNHHPVVLDAGCGVGESLRYMAAQLPAARFFGVTISPWQLDAGKKINQENGLEKRIEIHLADFQRLPFPNGFADAVFAIESVVYADGVGKERFLKEMWRVLKPGGRLVVVDGFRKGAQPFPRFFEKLYRKSLSAWAISELGEIGAFRHEMVELGFENITVENIGWHVLPSVLHVPLTMVRLVWKNLTWKGSPGCRRYLRALFWSASMGVWSGRFGYYMVSGEKLYL